MIRICFNEDDWQHELLSESGVVLASVMNLHEAEELKDYYEKLEKEEAERTRVEAAMGEDSSVYWSWRNQDELGGE